MLKSGNAWEVVTLVWLQTTAHFAKKANRIVQQVHLSLSPTQLTCFFFLVFFNLFYVFVLTKSSFSSLNGFFTEICAIFESFFSRTLSHLLAPAQLRQAVG